MELTLNTRELDIVGRRVEESQDATNADTDSLPDRPKVKVAHEEIERDPDTIPLGQGAPRLRARRPDRPSKRRRDGSRSTRSAASSATT